ncbi:ATP-binding protein, partial [Acidianus sp. RZ1]|uniref:AAA family ATPase n=1 Tax=Acidianus sp. RZ1 TaxID=1540082 RepID=UPI001491E7BA
MLFDERPKDSKKDLFDRENELSEILKSIKESRPLLLILGIRRIGKTSLLNVALKESKVNYILVDLRSLDRNYSRGELYNALAKGLSLNKRVLEFLKGLRGVKIIGNEVELRWKGRNSLSIPELLDRLNDNRAIIALDEAQKLRGPLSNEIKEAIAHAYDYDRNLTFLLTGSEVGLLYNFLGIEDPSSPLYGRYSVEIKLERFTKEKSIEFLEKGFDEIGISVSEEVLEEAYEKFDGIVGWLTFFGNEYSRERDFKRVLKIAVSLASDEIKNLEKISKRYITVLKCISQGNDNWSRVKGCVEKIEGSSISSSILSN